MQVPPRVPDASPRSRAVGRTPSQRPRLGRAVLRRLPLAGTLLGLAVALWLVATNDLGAVGTAFARVGISGLAGVVLVRVTIVLLCGLAWSCLLDRLTPTGREAFVVLRFVREGINVLLPVASVGGDVVGGRLLTFWGVPGGLAAASILADLLLQVGTQALFAGFGVLLLTRVEGASAAALADWTLRALLVATLVLAVFFALQRSRVARIVERWLADLGARFAREPGAPRTRPALSAADAGGVQGALDAVWAPGRLPEIARCFALHLGAWFLGAAEIWLALTCIGAEGITLADAVVIEALSQAIKSAAFPIPSGLGVQEGGFVVVCALFGIDPGTALALSLVKRVPDVVLGLPALLVWQNLEARRAAVAAKA